MRTLRLAVLGGLVWALAPGIGRAATLDVCALACTSAGSWRWVPP
jgi:hypothetical protein